MDPSVLSLPPGDPKLINTIVSHLKSQGLFDQFRRDCLADVDTKPAYQNLRHRVENYVSNFLLKQEWRPDLNKNQLRDTIRRHMNDTSFLATGVDHVVEQVVNPKVFRVFMPQIESVVLQLLGRTPPPDQCMGNANPKPEVKMEEPSPPYEVCGPVPPLTEQHPATTSVVSSCTAKAATDSLVSVPEKTVVKIEAESTQDDAKPQGDLLANKDACKNTVETQTDSSAFTNAIVENKPADETTGERKKSIGSETESDSTADKEKEKEGIKKEVPETEPLDVSKNKEKKDKVKNEVMKKDKDGVAGKVKSTDVKKPKLDKVPVGSSEKIKSFDKVKSEPDVRKANVEGKHKPHEIGKTKDHKRLLPAKSTSKDKTPSKSSSSSASPEKTVKSVDSKHAGDGNRQKSTSGDHHKLSSSHKSGDASRDGHGTSSESKSKSHELKSKSGEEPSKTAASADVKSKHFKQRHLSEKSSSVDKKLKVEERPKKHDVPKSEGKHKDVSDKPAVKVKLEMHRKSVDEKKYRSDDKSKSDGCKPPGHHHRSKSQENLSVHSKEMLKDAGKHGDGKEKPSKEHVKEKVHDKSKHSTPEKIERSSSASSVDRKRHSSETKLKHTPEKSSEEKTKAKHSNSSSSAKDKEKHREKEMKTPKKKEENVSRSEGGTRLSSEGSVKAKLEFGDKEKSTSRHVEGSAAKTPDDVAAQAESETSSKTVAQSESDKPENEKSKPEIEKSKLENEKAKLDNEKPKPESEKPKSENEKPKAESEKPKAENEKPKPDIDNSKPDKPKEKSEVITKEEETPPCGDEAQQTSVVKDEKKAEEAKNVKPKPTEKVLKKPHDDKPPKADAGPELPGEGSEGDVKKKRQAKVDDEEDRKSEGGWSDVTVSSVHTSDLSDYDDRITLTDSGDEERGSSGRTPKKKLEKSSAGESTESPEKLLSPDKPRRGRKRKKLLSDDPTFVSNSGHSDQQLKLAQQTPDSEPRRELRRQRKINPRYSSDEFASIFSKGKDKLHIGEMDDLDDDFIDKPRLSQRSLFDDRDDYVPKQSHRGRKSAPSTSSVENVTGHELDLPYSPRSDGSEMEGTSKNKDATVRPPSPKSDVSFDSSHTPHGPTTPDSMTSSEGRRRSMTTQSHETAKPSARGRRRGRPSEQRYNSTDLYKPRPVITSTSRRNRMTTPPPGNEYDEQSGQDDDAGKSASSALACASPALPERQRHEILVRHDYKVATKDEKTGLEETAAAAVKRPRGRPRKRPLPEPDEGGDGSPPKMVITASPSTGRPRGRPKLMRGSPGHYARRRK